MPHGLALKLVPYVDQTNALNVASYGADKCAVPHEALWHNAV
jgi:hypothetical protein